MPPPAAPKRPPPCSRYSSAKPASAPDAPAVVRTGLGTEFNKDLQDGQDYQDLISVYTDIEDALVDIVDEGVVARGAGKFNHRFRRYTDLRDREKSSHPCHLLI
jgi:hypothetical protein